jgi:hypothetical protein
MDDRRDTVKSVDFRDVFADIQRLQERSGMSFAAVTRLLIKEGLKSNLASALNQMRQGPSRKTQKDGSGKA